MICECGRRLSQACSPAICSCGRVVHFAGRKCGTDPKGGGVGTELKKILNRFWLRSIEGCNCDARAAKMDARGIEWCEANRPLICGWLREEAQARSLPVTDFCGNRVIGWAIRAAKRARKLAAG